MDLSAIIRILPDRRILEDTIFPYILSRNDYRRILFVGCRWYTRRYNRIFLHEDYCTVEPDPDQRRYGARRHIVDKLENLAAYFPSDSLDVVLCNGVFGWGIDDRLTVETALGACAECLRPGGLLLVGWNHTRRRSARTPGMYGVGFPRTSDALRGFERFPFPGIGTWRHATGGWGSHVFDFFLKKGRPSP